jgi:chromosome partitioning protein
MKVFSFFNSKGGVFKTGFTVEVGSMLKERGYRVLVIDMDQQSSLSRHVDADLTQNTIWDVLHTECSMIEAVQHTDFFDVICGSDKLSKIDRQFVDNDDRYILVDELESVENDYDVVLIDNGPSRTILVEMTICACDYIIIPTMPDEGSLDQVDTTIDEVEALVNNRNHDSHAKIIGYALTMYEGNTLYCQDALDRLNQKGEPVVTLSKTTALGDAKGLHTTAPKLKGSTSKVTKEINIITDMLEEVLNIG